MASKGNVVHQGESPADLPAGDARREAQARAADQLAEAAEARGIEGGAIDPKKFVIENEIAQHFNELEVTNAQPEYEYCWVHSGQHGRFIMMKMSERVKINGEVMPVWEVVQGDMPEARELKGQMADTTRRLGDVILMRARKECALRVRQWREQRRLAMFEGSTTELMEMGERHRHRGVVIRTDFGPDQLEMMGRRAMMRQQAVGMVDKMIRTGSVPGLGGPGSR